MDNRGLYDKFTVTRNDGKSEPGEKHHGCRYFVLDLDHDENALAALVAYERRCRVLRPALSADLQNLIADLASEKAAVGQLGDGEEEK